MNNKLKTEYQNLDWAYPIIEQQLKESPKSKISTIFLRLRGNPRLTLIGDYSLFYVIIKTLKNNKRNIGKNELRMALKISKELRNKETIADILFSTEFHG